MRILELSTKICNSRDAKSDRLERYIGPAGCPRMRSTSSGCVEINFWMRMRRRSAADGAAGGMVVGLEGKFGDEKVGGMEWKLLRRKEDSDWRASSNEEGYQEVSSPSSSALLYFFRCFRELILTGSDVAISSDVPVPGSKAVALSESPLLRPFTTISSSKAMLFCNSCFRDAGVGSVFAALFNGGTPLDRDSRYLHTALKSPSSTCGSGSSREIRSTAGGGSSSDNEMDGSGSWSAALRFFDLRFLDGISFEPFLAKTLNFEL